MNSELSILVYSCWKNRDMWEVFSKLFRKYWQSCDFQVALLTDEYHETEKEYAFTKIIEYDANWSQMIKNAIKQLNTSYVMLFMDDYLLCDYVNNEDILIQINRAKRYHTGNLRLIESPSKNGLFQGKEEIGYYTLGTAYSLSTQVGIWDSEYLCDILEDSWSAWDFERKASIKKKIKNKPILVSLDYVFPYQEGVRKGKWMIEGEKLCKRNGIKIDTQKRPVMSNKEMAKIYLKGAIIDWNPTLIQKIQNFLIRK